MAFDDKGWPVFPTRQGTPAGSAVERVMLESANGASGIVKRYMTQPDGSVVRLDTRGGMPEFVRETLRETSLSGGAIEMDSGVVDLISTSPLVYGYTDPGVIHNTNYVANHAASGQAIGHGKLAYPSLSGDVVADGSKAKAFTTDFERKTVTAHVPSSIFTGRMRLYVQSLYGGTWESLLLSDASGGSGRPMLGINTTDRETEGKAPVVIRSGTGLCFDTSTKQHYLIQVTEKNAQIFHLVGTPIAEKYRALLLDAALSEADAERIEAYVLSQSFPDEASVQTLTFEETPSESLGYGWHFNWSGNACDIINVEEKLVDDGDVTTYGFESTHYRLLFSMVDGVFSVTRSVISGPTEWSVPKNINVIAYPAWDGKLTKAGNIPSRILPSSRHADVYCYYKKDDLKILSVDTRTLNSGERERVSSPQYFGGSYYEDDSNRHLKEGENGESVGVYSFGATHCTFSVDSVSVGGYTGITSKRDYKATWFGRRTISEVLGSGSNTTVGNGAINTGSYGPLEINYGDPTLSYTFDGLGRVNSFDTTWETRFTEHRPGYASVVSYWYYLLWSIEDHQITDAEVCKTLVVIPYSDAEAVYIASDSTLSRTGTVRNYVAGNPAIGGYSASATFDGSGGVYTDLGYYNVINVATWPLNTIYVPQTTQPENTDTSSSDKHLLCRSGSLVPVVLPGYGDFFSTSGSVQQNYQTLSSVNGATASAQTASVIGMTTVPTKMTFVGWA